MPETAEASPRPRRRDIIPLLATWLLLATTMMFFARQNLSVPGLYYDEAVFAGLAKDFATGNVHGQHMPDHKTVTLAGRPFPLFVQTYLGALKSWMLIPAFGLFGSTTAVLRASNLFWQLTALLLLMLAVRRRFGLGMASMAGALLVFDPTFFFLSTLDWGAAVPSFVCRCACFFFAVRWSQVHKLRDAFLIGLFAGLGFFNKADFAVFLIAVSLAALICYWRQIVVTSRTNLSSVTLACFGFVLGAGVMLIKIPRMLALIVSGPHPNAPGEFGVKLKTLMSMYDGSHFYRLMNVGGVFERMYGEATGPKTLTRIALVAACIAIFALAYKKQLRALVFLTLTGFLITLGVFALPDAVRIHHAFLVYPFPQLIIAACVTPIWNAKALLQIVTLLAIVIVCGAGLLSITATQKLIRETGGRGRWSESFDRFCCENQNRSDLTIVSLDWGFNEQLIFLSDGPQLSEPFWNFNQTLSPLPDAPNYIYLAHPPKYSVLNYDVAYLNQFRNNPNVEITPHFDRQNEVAFYTIRFRPR
jgi:hypothetical protein